METVFDSSAADVLVKVGVFVLIQGLVYLILSKSSNIFSKSKMARSFSFRPPRSSSIRRIIGSIADFPAAADDSSPVAKQADSCEFLSLSSFKTD